MLNGELQTLNAKRRKLNHKPETLQTHQRFLKIPHSRRLLAYTCRDRVSLLTQPPGLLLHAARKLFVQTSIISDYPPVRRYRLLASAAVFLGGFRGDTDKDACPQRTGYIDFVVARKARPDFRNSH